MNKKNDKKLLSWKEAYKTNQKAFRLIYKKYPNMFISRIVNVIWNAFTPYIGIYLSALIIEELSAGRNPKKLGKINFDNFDISRTDFLIFRFSDKMERYSVRRNVF